jgi:hypothetical protein
VFVYDGHFLRDVTFVIELTKPLVHHSVTSRKFMEEFCAGSFDGMSACLLKLQHDDVLERRLLPCLCLKRATSLRSFSCGAMGLEGCAVGNRFTDKLLQHLPPALLELKLDCSRLARVKVRLLTRIYFAHSLSMAKKLAKTVRQQHSIQSPFSWTVTGFSSTHRDRF